MSKRSIGILLLLGFVAFYAFGTGFTFFYRFLYVLLLLLSVGLTWAWLNLRGLDVQLSRFATRGQVGGYLEGRIRVLNRIRLPKSWLEVAEISDLPGHMAGRGVAMVRDQSRTWKTETYLSRRGVYQTGQVMVTSQDPFGLFRLRRRFLKPQPYTVLPAAEPLPDLHPSFANLPSEGRTTRHWDQITTDVASVRPYSHGDSLRRIHWPYTARMNHLMVKEFDMGMSSEAWVVLDMEEAAHVQSGSESLDNTEELAVNIAASLISRLSGFSLPMGLATNADPRLILRPNSSPEYLGKLMEALAVVRARGATPLERFLYELRPSLSRFNTMTVISPSPRPEWVPALATLRRRGVTVSVVMIDPQGFGDSPGIDSVLGALLVNDLPTYVVNRGVPLNEALRSSAPRHSYLTTAASNPPAGAENP
ncbi:MAG: hypothetical protein CL696_13115 [Chloroflexi bacterium]|nr:hypothetical protein [Chloroflexota bacterium]|tara:strand:- start:2334 stop:3596 length:1263 start_codon:yes stop_codon:yes gene_type:complete